MGPGSLFLVAPNLSNAEWHLATGSRMVLALRRPAHMQTFPLLAGSICKGGIFAERLPQEDEVLWYPQIWDFKTAKLEATLRGHGGDVKTCDWHPSKGVVASASKDNVIKLWDPRGGKDALATLQGHNASIMQARPLLVAQARTNLLSIGMSAA